MFRTASPYHNQVSPQYQLGQTIGGLIGMAIAKNAADREQAKINDGLLRFEENANSSRPNITSTTMDGQPIFQTDYSNAPLNTQFSGQQGGLLSGQFSGNLGGGVKNAFWSTEDARRADGLSGMTPPTLIPGEYGANIPGPAPAPVTTPKFQTSTRAWNDVRGEYIKNQVAQMKALRKEIGDTAFAKIYPQLRQQIAGGVATLQDDYNRQVENSAVDAVTKAQTPQEQRAALLQYAKTTRKSPDWIKGIIGNNIKREDDGANIYWYRTDNYGTPLDADESGKPKPYHVIPKQLSPGQVQQGELANKRLDIRSSNTNGKLGPQEKWAQGYELNGYHRDEATLQEYQDALAAGEVSAALQKASNAASSRMNQYWTISSGGAYQPGQGQPQKSETPKQPANARLTTNPQTSQELVLYQQTKSKIREQYPDATDDEIDQFIKEQAGE